MLKKISLLLMLVLLLTVTGCEPTEKLTGKKGEVKDVTGQKDPITTVVKDPNPLTKEYVVYRVQKNGEEILIPEKVRYAPGKKTREEAALYALIHTDPISKQLMNLFPPGTEVLSAAAQGDTLFITFNEAFLGRYSDEPGGISSGSWKTEGPLRRQLCLDSLVSEERY